MDHAKTFYKLGMGVYITINADDMGAGVEGANRLRSSLQPGQEAFRPPPHGAASAHGMVVEAGGLDTSKGRGNGLF